MLGKFITVEGIEGAGKSTAVGYLAKVLEQNAIHFVLTREPGGTVIAEAIRKILLVPTQERICVDTEVLLMFAARAQHLHQVIWPALKVGKWVICDRFTDATYAYQGGGRGSAKERIAEIEEWVQGATQPDFIIVLDVCVELGMQRIVKRGNGKDRIEREKINFFERVRQAYLERAKQDPKRYCIVDANRKLGEVQEDLHHAIMRRIKQWS